MKITYDPEADALYIELRKKVRIVSSLHIEEGVVADLDKEGHVIGFEILDARERLGEEDLSSISYENLVSEKKAKVSLP